MKEIVKGMWQFAKFLFVPRWGRTQPRTVGKWKEKKNISDYIQVEII